MIKRFGFLTLIFFIFLTGYLLGNDNAKSRYLAIYYGDPLAVNGAGSLGQAEAEFTNFDVVVLGAGLETNSNPNVASLIQYLTNYGTKVYGYIDLGITSSPPSGLSGASMSNSVVQWRNKGAQGIFWDDAGYDYDTTRERQNMMVDWTHANGMDALMNPWNPDDVMSANYDANGNPNSLPTHLTNGDGILFESFLIDSGDYQSLTSQMNKANKLKSYQTNKGIVVYCVATEPNITSTSYTTNKYEYAYWGDVLYDFDYFQYTDPNYSASNQTLVYIKQPTQDIGSNISAISNQNNYNFRLTTYGRIVLEGDSSSWGLGAFIYTNSSPPNDISGLTITVDSNGGALFLNWTNSSDPDLKGVMIRRKAGSSISTNINDGTLVAQGYFSSYKDTGLVNEQTYSYRIWAYDFDGNYSPGNGSGTTASGVPSDTVPPGPVQDPSITILNDKQHNGIVYLKWTSLLDGDQKIIDDFDNGLDWLDSSYHAFGSVDITSDPSVYLFSAKMDFSITNAYGNYFILKTFSSQEDWSSYDSLVFYVKTTTEINFQARIYEDNNEDKIEDDVWVYRRDQLSASDEFEEIIVPLERRYFSDEGSPKVDDTMSLKKVLKFAFLVESPYAGTTGSVYIDSVQLLKSENADFQGVRILRKTSGFSTSTNDGTFLVEGNISELEDPDSSSFVNGTNYYYTLFSYDASGNYTPAAEAAHLSIVYDTNAPGTVTNLQASAGDGQVSLHWENTSGIFISNISHMESSSGWSKGGYNYNSVDNLTSILGYNNLGIWLSGSIKSNGNIFMQYSFSSAQNWTNFSTLNFYYKGNGTPSKTSVYLYQGTDVNTWQNSLGNIGTNQEWQYVSISLDASHFSKPSWASNVSTNFIATNITKISFLIEGPNSQPTSLAFGIDEIFLSVGQNGYVGTKIVRNRDHVPTSMWDGKLIYNGVETNCVDTTVDNGITYYYAGFSYDQYNNALSPPPVGAYTLAIPGIVFIQGQCLRKKDNAPLANISITLVDKYKKVFNTKADASGNFFLGVDDPGSYSLSFSDPSELYFYNGQQTISLTTGTNQTNFYFLPANMNSQLDDDMHVFPNPVTADDSEVTFLFKLKTASVVNVVIYDLNGRKVRTLIAHQAMDAGVQTIKWDLKDDNGNLCENGFYLYVLQTKDKKMIKTIGVHR